MTTRLGNYELLHRIAVGEDAIGFDVNRRLVVDGVAERQALATGEVA